ncbi:MAG: carboxymuconolactone decarboxylase family protein [Acidobacteriota bacterium]
MSAQNHAAIAHAGHRAAPSSKNLPLPDERAANAEVRQLFARYRERFGRADLPGIVQCFATNPALLAGMMQIAEGLLFGESLLSRRHKEMIATYISGQNACAYCADSHGVLLGAQGGSAELICALRQSDLNAQLFSIAEMALLKFAAKVNANAPAVTSGDVERAVQTGWTEAQVAEAVHIAALFAAFNRIANGFGLPSPYTEGE